MDLPDFFHSIEINNYIILWEIKIHSIVRVNVHTISIP